MTLAAAPHRGVTPRKADGPLRRLLRRLPMGPRLVEIEGLGRLLLAAGALFVFVRLADEIAEGETDKLDRAILLALRNPADPADPIGPAWLELAFQDITSLGGHTVLTLVTAAVLGFLLVVRKRAAALLLLVAVGGGALLSSVLKLGFARPRPDLVAHLVEVQTASFPSGHAMLSAITYLTLGALLARVQPRRRVKAYLIGVAITLTMLIGTSRIYLGVHWPSDVLAGWCVGAAWALGCWLVALWLQARGDIEPDSASPEPPPSTAES